MLIDYHIHSEFSNDSTTPMEKQIEKAISLGVDEICFTDHVDYGIKKDWTEDDICDGTEKNFSDISSSKNVCYPEYFVKLFRMKKIYGDKIAIKNGLELGVQQHTVNSYQKLLKEYGNQLDFVLLSVHQIDNKEFWNGEYFVGKTPYEYNLGYYTELLNVIRRFRDFNVLAHIDLIRRYDPCGENYSETDGFPLQEIEKILTEIFKIIIEDNKGIEINTSSWRYNLADVMPSKDILRLYRSLGGKIITIGSDAHTPEYIADRQTKAKQVLKQIGFDEIYTFEKRKPIPHKI